MDSGPGIPVADRGRVFRRFYRLESSRSTPGSGLGLSLVEAIAALHQVSIELTDNCPGLRITLRFFAADQRMLAGNRLGKHETKGERSPAGEYAPVVYRDRYQPAALEQFRDTRTSAIPEPEEYRTAEVVEPYSKVKK